MGNGGHVLHKPAPIQANIATEKGTFCDEGGEHITGETLITDAGMHLGFAPMTAR